LQFEFEFGWIIIRKKIIGKKIKDMPCRKLQIKAGITSRNFMNCEMEKMKNFSHKKGNEHFVAANMVTNRHV
jgi:hypothetical protein